METKPKLTQPKKPAAKKRPASPRAETTNAAPNRYPKAGPKITINTLPEAVQKLRRWDPRVTVYVTNSADLAKMMKRKGFNRQSPEPPLVIGDFQVQEIGALHDPQNDTLQRIVEVVKLSKVEDDE